MIIPKYEWFVDERDMTKGFIKTEEYKVLLKDSFAFFKECNKMFECYGIFDVRTLPDKQTFSAMVDKYPYEALEHTPNNILWTEKMWIAAYKRCFDRVLYDGKLWGNKYWSIELWDKCNEIMTVKDFEYRERCRRQSIKQLAKQRRKEEKDKQAHNNKFKACFDYVPMQFNNK